MDPIERQLRRKLGGPRSSQTRNMPGLKNPGSKDRAKRHRAKLKELPQAIKEVERQIESHQNDSPVAPTIDTPPQGRTIAVVGDVCRFLTTGDDTNGKYALWEALVSPGGGPPPPIYRREEEGFYVLAGEITFTAACGRSEVWG